MVLIIVVLILLSFRSLAALFENPKLDPDLRCLLRDTFPDFCTPVAETIPDPYPKVIEPLPKRMRMWC